jgi:CRISPR system Cascade subunit CasC
MNNRLFVDIHVLQTVPPSCINRDDTGSPKIAIYGGVTRARVSSQCWKRAVRLMFKDLYPDEQLAYRTKRIVDMVANEIRSLDANADAEAMATAILKSAGLKIKDSEKTTSALFFMSMAQAKALARLALEDPETVQKSPSKEAKQKVIRTLNEYPGIEIALFGRMVADEPSLNTDACAQVAHSISTHRVTNEYDYFTAVDDLSPEDSTGAGHIGTVEYNSSTLYRYATVAVHALGEHLEDETATAVKNFVYAFVCSMPDGKQNTFANRTLPDAVMVTLRRNQPINLVGAFEQAVPPSEKGYVLESAKRLATHAKSVYENFAGYPLLSLTTGAPLAETGIGETVTLDELLVILEYKVDTELWGENK